MMPRILSIAGPLFAYVTLALLLWALWHQRRKVDWVAGLLALAGLLASWLLLDPVHRLFFDEDIYISIAANLARAPVAQITLMGGPEEIVVSTYYKEPSGWPAILSLLFLVTGPHENVAFLAARIFYALGVAAVYLLARELLQNRHRAIAAAVLFGAAPACFWFSVSAGTDIPGAFFAVLGLWGLFSGSGALAATGLAMAAQVRLELIVMIPAILLARNIPARWKLIAFGLVVSEVAHIVWVFSVAPMLAKAEGVDSAFSLSYLPANLWANLAYVFNPFVFPAVSTSAALWAAVRLHRRRAHALPLYFQIVSLMAVYLLFYAGSFQINPRYSIQILAPLAVLAASLPRIGLLIVATAALPYLQEYSISDYVTTLAADHRKSVEFVSRVGPNDLIVSTEQEMFLNQGRSAMSAVLATEQPERLKNELRKGRRVLYHSGARTNVEGRMEWKTDRRVKSDFELHLIDSSEVAGMRIAFYELLLKPLDRETR